MSSHTEEAKPAVLDLGPASAPAVEDKKSAPYQFAQEQKLQVSPSTHGQWSSWDEHRLRWRLEIVSSNAKSLSLKLENLNLPPRSELLLYGTAKPQHKLLLDQLNNRPDRAYWTPEFHGEHLILEWILPKDQREHLPFTITSAFVGFR